MIKNKLGKTLALAAFILTLGGVAGAQSLSGERCFDVGTRRCCEPICKPGTPCPEFIVCGINPLPPPPVPGPIGCPRPVCEPGHACPDYACVSPLSQ